MVCGTEAKRHRCRELRMIGLLIAEGLKIDHLASCMLRAVGVMQYAVGNSCEFHETC